MNSYGSYLICQIFLPSLEICPIKERVYSCIVGIRVISPEDYHLNVLICCIVTSDIIVNVCWRAVIISLTMVLISLDSTPKLITE